MNPDESHPSAQVGDPSGWANYVQTQTHTAAPTLSMPTPFDEQPNAGVPPLQVPPAAHLAPPAAPPPGPASGTMIDPGFDRAPIQVSGLIPIMATPASRPLRTVAWLLLVVGIVGIVLSVVGGVAWSGVVEEVVDSTMGDVQDAMDDSEWDNNIDIDSTGDNLSRVLGLLGAGIAAIGAMLGLTIVAIGGMALQLDRVLAPSRKLADSPTAGHEPAP